MNRNIRLTSHFDKSLPRAGYRRFRSSSMKKVQASISLNCESRWTGIFNYRRLEKNVQRKQIIWGDYKLLIRSLVLIVEIRWSWCSASQGWIERKRKKPSKPIIYPSYFTYVWGYEEGRRIAMPLTSNTENRTYNKTIMDQTWNKNPTNLNSFTKDSNTT